MGSGKPLLPSDLELRNQVGSGNVEAPHSCTECFGVFRQPTCAFVPHRVRVTEFPCSLGRASRGPECGILHFAAKVGWCWLHLRSSEDFDIMYSVLYVEYDISSKRVLSYMLHILKTCDLHDMTARFLQHFGQLPVPRNLLKEAKASTRSRKSPSFRLWFLSEVSTTNNLQSLDW